MDYEVLIARLPAKDRRLPKAFKAKWLKALRSGDYEQSMSTLFNHCGGFCCLGVAGDINGVNRNLLSGYDMPSGIVNQYRSKRVPAILLEDYNDAGRRNLPTLLAKMNDNGYSFKQIADIVELHC